jgi:hypothetical protein
MGVSPEVFEKYNRETPSTLDPVQAEINKRCGLSEEAFLKYANPR